MNHKIVEPTTVVLWVCVLFLACVSGAICPAQTSQPNDSALSQTAFATPELAAAALIEATGEYDVASLTAILGPDSADVIGSGDSVRDKNNAAEFANWGKEKKTIELNKSKTRAILSVGAGD